LPESAFGAADFRLATEAAADHYFVRTAAGRERGKTMQVSECMCYGDGKTRKLANQQ
jgi:hypothetical protein